MPPAKKLPAISRIDFFREDDENLPNLGARALAEFLDQKFPPKLTPKQLAIYAWGRLQVDVCNGGFEQFYYNHRGNAGVAAAAALVKELGFPKVAATLNEAELVYRRNVKLFQTSDPWRELFGKIPDFPSLSRRFCQAQISPARAIGKWLRENVNKLFVGDDGRPIDVTFTGTVSIARKGAVLESLEVRRGKAHGKHRQFFEDGSPRHAEFYASGKKAGELWPNGQIRVHERRDGANRVKEWFFPSGAVQKRITLDRDGFILGAARLYYENGQLAEEVYMRRLDQFGSWTKFFEDGSPKLQAEYGEERKVVIHNAWDENRRQVVKNGTGVFLHNGPEIHPTYALFFESSWIREQELKAGIRHGTEKTWHRGYLWSISSYRQGKPHGEQVSYWDNGRQRHVSRYVAGKLKSTQSFPRFDDPRPVVILDVEANERLYTSWKHVLPDEYPQVVNLEQIRRDLKMPQMLIDVDQRNREGKLKEAYEDWNTFNDGIGYWLEVDDKGRVKDVSGTASGAYSSGLWNTYIPLLRRLKFKPGRHKNKSIACRVFAKVDHTFRESKDAP